MIAVVGGVGGGVGGGRTGSGKLFLSRIPKEIQTGWGKPQQ